MLERGSISLIDRESPSLRGQGQEMNTMCKWGIKYISAEPVVSQLTYLSVC